MDITADGTGVLNKLLEGNYSLVGVLVILYVLTLVFESKSPGILTRINPVNWITSLLGLFGFKKKNSINLIDKSLYYNHIDYKKSLIQNVKTGDLGKDEILKTLISDIIDSFESNFKDIFDNSKQLFKDSSSNKEIVDIFSKISQNFVSDYKIAWKRDEIPNEVIAKFSAWNEMIEKIFLGHLQDLSSMHPDRDRDETIVTCLQFIVSMISVIIEESGDIMHNMNGTLNGIKFKNTVIGKYDSYGVLKQKTKGANHE